MEHWLALAESWPGARWLQASGTAYLIVNATHILGVGLLLGAIVPLDLRLIGLLRADAEGDALRVLVRVLPRAAGWGLALALGTGVWLFSVRPQDYVSNTAFLVKMLLLLAALLNVLWQHRTRVWARVMAGETPGPGVRLRAALSLLLWLAVLLAGRWIGFL